MYPTSRTSAVLRSDRNVCLGATAGSFRSARAKLHCWTSQQWQSFALTWLVVSLIALASTGPAPAQSVSTASTTSSSSSTAADLPATLDEALARAMERNPDIITAMAKLRLAEAELNSTRNEVASKAIELWGEHRRTTHT